ncbi:hypothetical protein SDC9_36713 [bioreactor metagenome]|uniref:Uncharacterized protein n=1 Tax=bioreactor metagenome TaxID=1076179 RepID=A0A644VH01_9ZZZZ
MKEIIIAGVFTIIGASLGFLGTLIQSKISARSNIEMVNTQSEKEVERHRYLEKEKLYSDIITLLPQFMYSIDRKTKTLSFDEKSTVQLNSFKARLSVYSTAEIYKEFFALTDFLCTEESEDLRIDKLNSFTDILVEDLKKA